MITLKKFSGKVKPPSEMSSRSLVAYLKWTDHYLKWCDSYYDRQSLKDYMIKKAAPYYEELKRRREEIHGPRKT